MNVKKWIEKIRQYFETDSIFYTRHAKLEMAFEEYGRIFDYAVGEAIKNGEILEEYPEDKPYPSALIFGTTSVNRPLHIVCATNEKENQAIIITVYQPDPELWEEFRRRKPS